MAEPREIATLWVNEGECQQLMLLPDTRSPSAGYARLGLSSRP